MIDPCSLASQQVQGLARSMREISIGSTADKSGLSVRETRNSELRQRRNAQRLNIIRILHYARPRAERARIYITDLLLRL